MWGWVTSQYKFEAGNFFTEKSLLLGSLNDKDTIRGEGGGHLIQVNIIRNGVRLSELLSMVLCLYGELPSIKFDGDIIRSKLLHVESKLVITASLVLEKYRGVSFIVVRSLVVLCSLDSVCPGSCR